MNGQIAMMPEPFYSPYQPHLYPNARPYSSFDVATSLMSPHHVSAKLRDLDIPIFSIEDKKLNRREVAFGVDAGTTKEMVLEMLSTGLPVPGLQQASVLIGVPFAFWARDYNAQRDMEKLVEQYREVIAEKTNLEPEQVDENVLVRYATQNEELASAIQFVAKKRSNHIATNFSAIGGMMGGGALAAMAAAPFTGGFTLIPILASCAGGFLGFDVGKSIGNYLMDVTDATNPDALIEAMKAKQEKGVAVTAKDIFTLRLAQYPKVQEAIQFQHGRKFYELDEGAQMEVISGHRELWQRCARDAICCNMPGADINYLMVGEMPGVQGVRDPAMLEQVMHQWNPASAQVMPQQPTQWMNRFGSNEQLSPRRSFVQAELDRRAVANAAQQHLS